MLIVMVEVTGAPFTGTTDGLKEHTGGIVTSGVIELHESVTPGVFGGLIYPLIGLMMIVPWAPLPAGTLLGDIALSTVMVNCAVTASTVRVSGGAFVVCPVEGAVPVMVML